MTPSLGMGSDFWIGLIQIIGIDIVLSGDNAVVIALASRALPPDQQRKAIIFGTVGAVLMRVSLAVVALELLEIPYLKLIGALLLFWIGIKLLIPESAEGDGISAGNSLFAAIRTIMIADLVMSLDNVIAVAAAAKSDVLLLVIGLALSIPLVIFGSTLLLRLMERFPLIITVGAAILGFVAGEMAVNDPATRQWITDSLPALNWLLPAAGTIGVVAIGKLIAARRGSAPSPDLLAEPPTASERKHQ